eukprot:5410622-Amphidinium_carterae.3
MSVAQTPTLAPIVSTVQQTPLPQDADEADEIPPWSMGYNRGASTPPPPPPTRALDAVTNDDDHDVPTWSMGLDRAGGCYSTSK